MTLHSVRERALLVAPIRIVLGLVWVGAAIVAGAGKGPALLAGGSAAFMLVFIAFNDPRSRFRRGVEPKAAPADAHVAPRWQQALMATLPSTAGVTVLAAIAVVPQPILSAFLGGISAGLGIAGVWGALIADPALYVEPKSGIVYRR